MIVSDSLTLLCASHVVTKMFHTFIATSQAEIELDLLAIKTQYTALGAYNFVHSLILFRSVLVNKLLNLFSAKCVHDLD